MPKTARKGALIEISVIAQHDMETGFRRTETGELIPRDIIRTFTCTYNNIEVFRADLHPGQAANPKMTFTVVASESGEFQFKWVGDNNYISTNQSFLIVN
jgi:sulfur-oxidizing protein SoxZ